MPARTEQPPYSRKKATLKLGYGLRPDAGKCRRAGGFHEGVKRAYDEGYDWLWLMDDDVEPVPDALSTMLSYSSVSECIQGSKIFKDGESEGWRNGVHRRVGLSNQLG